MVNTFRRSLRGRRGLLHHSCHGYKFIAFAFIALNHPIRGDHRLRAVRPHLLVSAVMQQDHIPASNVLGDFLFDHRGRRAVPVVAGDVPQDGFKAEFASNAEYGGAAASEGWAEEI